MIRRSLLISLFKLHTTTLSRLSLHVGLAGKYYKGSFKKSVRTIHARDWYIKAFIICIGLVCIALNPEP